MNDATNDANEFESSLDGAIGFFQNLRRKLGTLEQEASVQHDRLHAIAASIAHLEQGRQIDQQTFAALAGHLESQTAQLTELRADGRLLDEQIDAIEALVACFQQTQEQLRHQLAALAGDWQAQQADLRQDLEATLEQRASAEQVAALETQLARQAEDLRNLLASAQTLSQDTRVIRDRSAGHESRLEQHHGQIGRLEAAVRTSQAQLGQFNSLAETQYQHLHRLESALGTIDQNIRSFGQVADGLKTTLDRHDHALDTLYQAVETHETAQRQWREQQGRLDEFADALDARYQESQTLQQALAQVRDELETQHQTLHEARQTRQDVQKQQDRLKHLETLTNKLSADTNSTRQILNILQSDLITQSDTLRELDEHWQATLTAYQSTALPSETSAQSPVPPDSSPDADLRETAQQHAATLIQALELQQSDVRETAATVEDLQQEVGELRQILTRLEATADQQQLGTQFAQLNDAIDAIRADAKNTQAKVITMAGNVMKRIFEFQNQLTATETAHATRLQEAEQKLIQLQAALETLETQRRPRRWFSMPAMFTHLTLTVGAAFLAVLVTVIWTTI
jgi:chromosome segregation ATPase